MDVKALISNLKELDEVLSQQYSYGWAVDFSGLNKAIKKLEYLKSKIIQGRPLSFRVSNLSFKLPVKQFQHCIPNNCTKANLYLSIDFSFNQNQFNFNDLDELNLNIEIISTDEDAQTYKSAWHLDFHKTDLNESFAHPKFHIQFGGKKMRESMKVSNSSLNSGEVFLLDAPRLAHPPMDLVLAIDFVVSNFIGVNDWKKLRQVPMFIHLHKVSETLFWKPYFTEIFNYFDRDKNSPIGDGAKFLVPGLAH